LISANLPQMAKPEPPGHAAPQGQHVQESQGFSRVEPVIELYNIFAALQQNLAFGGHIPFHTAPNLRLTLERQTITPHTRAKEEAQ
jgi:hypothetical protein